MNARVAPFGSWESPISEEDLVKGQVRLSDPLFDGDDIYWLEADPEDGGRTRIMRLRDGVIDDLLPQPFYTRTLVHEYGGAAYQVHQGTVFFSNFSDQRIWRIPPGGKPEPLTAAGEVRFADYVVDGTRQRLIAVRENHGTGSRQPVNELVEIALADGAVKVLASGHDFYATPRIDPGGKQLAWLAWDHPNMPWDHTLLYRADFAEDGSLSDPVLVAGQQVESVFQPAWSPEGRLLLASDRSNWWNLYGVDDDQLVPLCPREAEFGRPQWIFRLSVYGFADFNRIITTYNVDGRWHLAGLDAKTGSLVDFKQPYSQVIFLRVRGSKALFVGSSPEKQAELVLFDLNSGKHEVIRASSSSTPDPRVTSKAEAVTFPTDDGEVAHGFYYPPFNEGFTAPAGTVPPLITIVHGGPTGQSDDTFGLDVQYWTSRGFAVFDVNHRGSSGYGRAFRDRLKGNWGVIDVADVAAGARWLASQGKADAARLIIRGGSAGGYTTLASLAFQDTFRAGASYYGISDLVVLAGDTHKFESRYCDQLIASWPDQKALFEERSPINHLDGLDQPIILFQGLEDKVVPPNQSQLILDALMKRGVPVAYVPFEGEQHGFRKAKNIVRAREAELYFYARVFGFPLPGDIEPVKIHNLELPQQ